MPAIDDALQRIVPSKHADLADKLARLASSPFPPEAAQAAQRACRLVREHALRIIDQAALDAILDVVRELERCHTEDREYIATLERERVEREAEYEKAKRATARPTIRPRQFASRFAGHCATCGESYDVGDHIWWQRGLGAWHLECDVPED
jgi:hypothetical protein